MSDVIPYVVRVRNTREPVHTVWGDFVQRARTRAGMGRTALARRINSDRSTIYRWETKGQRPEDADQVAAVADALGLSREEALAAAGFRPGVEAPRTPLQDLDHEIELVRSDPKLDASTKQRIIDMILDRRTRERNASLEETRRIIETLREQRRAR